MKRLIISLLLVGAVFGGLSAQHKTVSPFLNIPGVLKKDVEEVKKGTPCKLLYVIKLKKYETGESPYKAVFLIDGVQTPLSMDGFRKYFQADSLGKDAFWQLAQIDLIEYYEKKGYQEGLRQEQRQEADRYVQELENASLMYDDAALEDWLQCLVLGIVPEQMTVKREGIPLVRIFKSAAPDMMMLSNNTLLVSTGMLATIDTEDEMVALLAREVTHHLFDHALVTVNKNIARARRAAFWGSVMNGVVAAAEETLAERHEHYQPGLLFATNDLIQALVNQRIANRMGMDYSEEQEEEADDWAVRFMVNEGRNKDALCTALHKIKDYYKREKDAASLSKYGAYGSLHERLEKMGAPSELPRDRNFQKRMMSVVSFEAAMHDYNKDYVNARRLAMKNIRNEAACADDFFLVARSLMKLENTPESNAECLLYLDKADMMSNVENVNITKMKILLMFRAERNKEAVDLLKKYQGQLDILFTQPHTEEDAKWITSERQWADKQLERIYLL